MTNYRRPYIAGATYFFTVVTYERIPFFSVSENIELLKAAWKETICWRPFTTDAIVVLPDHLHTLWILPEEDADFSIRWSYLKGLFSRKFHALHGRLPAANASRRDRGEAAIWQRRFRDHLIRSDEDYARHVDYIHYNPVKHGYVQKPSEWRWSSFQQFVQRGCYTQDWGSIEPVPLNRKTDWE